ncbi:MAG: MFS transporter [Chloroflexi bacterium]|nr:MFS transporter [Chloroflexota bacterium]
MTPAAPLVAKSKIYNADMTLVKATLLITGSLTVMAGAIISPALPTIEAQFADIANVKLLVRLVLTMPALFIALGGPVAGYIADAFGRKRLLVSALLLYAIGGSVGLVANSLGVLLVGRAFLGIAVAGIMTTVTTLIADYYQGAARATFIGFQVAFMGLGGMVFLALGGVLADVGWRYPFLVYLVALVLLPLVIVVLYEPPRRETVLATDAQTVVPLPVGLMAFIYIFMTMTHLTFYIIPVFLSFHLADLLSASATQAGLSVAWMSLFFSVGSSQYGRVGRRLGFIGTLILALLITGSGYIIITLARDWLLLAVGLVLAGSGFGLVIPNLNVGMANSVPEAVRGRALGGLTTAVFLGQFLAPLAGQPLANIVGETNIYAAAGVFMLAALVGLFVFRKPLARLVK